MEQLFGLVNQILSQSQSTRERNLHMRTYKVLPLTPTVGVLEWVLNTVLIGTWLIDAHAKCE